MSVNNESVSMEQIIREKLSAALSPAVLEVENESHQHSRGTETHYKVVVVAEKFMTLSRVERSRLVHDVLKAEFAKVHSITTRLLSPQEWEQKGESADFASPRCQGKA